MLLAGENDLTSFHKPRFVLQLILASVLKNYKMNTYCVL